MKKRNESTKKHNKWLALINIPIQMGVIIFLFHKLGIWLDENHSHKNIYYYKLFTMIGVFVSLYNVYRQVNEMGKKQ
jgi:Putative F0F1-ATPase subunit Ca2+/Mg2+ transporter